MKFIFLPTMGGVDLYLTGKGVMDDNLKRALPIDAAGIDV